jgi:hypothetical protein
MNFWPFKKCGAEEKRHNEIINALKLMATTQQELTAQLTAQGVQADKIAAEQQKRFDDVTGELAALRAQIDAGAITTELQAAADKLQGKLDALDATIPDAPTPPV